MKKTAQNIKIIIITVIVVMAFAVKTTKAQTRIPLVVAPARQQITIDPGKSDNLIIKFFNESSSPVSGVIKAVDFIVTGADGNPKLLDQESANLTNQYSGASWVKLPYEKATIAAGDVLKVNFKLNVPKDAKAGGHYVAIYFESVSTIAESSTNSEEASAILPKIVGLLYIRVSGSVTESAFIDSVKIPAFLEFGPVPVSFNIINRGNYHISPKGQVSLTNYFGRIVDEKILDSKNIFPDTNRSYETKLGNKWLFGKYKVDLTASYGESGKVLTQSAFVWIVPITLIIIILLLVISIILGIVLVSKSITGRQKQLEKKLEGEITELEALKEKYKDSIPPTTGSQKPKS